MIPISKLKLNPTNPRTIKKDQLEKLKRSIKSFPEMMEKRPMVCVTDKDGKIYPLGGNMRLRAIKEMGFKEIPETWVALADEWTEEQRMEFVIKDNSNLGSWDFDALVERWNIDDLEEWGVDLEWDEVEELEAEEDDFDVELPEEPKTVLGDLYEIGEHRLLCGDSTDSEQVAKLMNGEKAEISFTSPPYNAGKTPTEVKMGKNSKYANDNDNKTETEYLNLLVDFTNNTLLFSEYSFVNIQSLSGNKTALIDFLYNMKSFYADTLIWQKQNAQPAMAENVLNSQFEYIHVFSHKANRHIGTKKFRGTLSNVLDISKQNKNAVKEHNATFPVDFAAHFVSNFCELSVLDLFLGSGTTMVAAHQLKRKCYGMELDPKYCDVIINRMIKLDPDLRIKRNGVDVTNEYIVQ
ncbi:MAG TPA: DNA modification methylase [Bacteroidales bacterium]|nr:DNA modification methylase [Bacteroidales bacterium]